MKNEKGFTLIELLAVLVVLAIIALISVPITIRIINNARENSYKRSITAYGKAFEQYIAMSNIDNAQNDYDFLFNYQSKVENVYSGNRVTCEFKENDNSDENYSTLINGKLALRGCRVGDHSNVYDYTNGKVDKANTYDLYEMGKTIKVANTEYQVIHDGGVRKDYVVAIKTKALTLSEVEMAGGSGHSSFPEQCGSVIFGSTNNYTNSNVRSIVDNWADITFTNNELKEVEGYTARLINISEIENLGYVKSGMTYRRTNQTIGNVSNGSSWHWTMTPLINSNDQVWYVDYEVIGILGVSSSDCIRPVINVRKDKIDN